jgi:nitroimidazol reductase NimA-like FMN-containing flavoprotein (pyridoxamine 5'-phosphate oxidase superfamily)
MSLTMTVAEREAFLADVHVAVLSVERPDRAPLAVPVWYGYSPGSTVTIITSPTSRKGLLIAEAGRFSLCVQTEMAPYKYVTVEGPVEDTIAPVPAAERRAQAHRYLGREFGDLYIDTTEADARDNVMILMRPETWFTTDYNKFTG